MSVSALCQERPNTHSVPLDHVAIANTVCWLFPVLPVLGSKAMGQGPPSVIELMKTQTRTALLKDTEHVMAGAVIFTIKYYDIARKSIQIVRVKSIKASIKFCRTRNGIPTICLISVRGMLTKLRQVDNNITTDGGVAMWF
mmetsp:Transcript_6165/g.13970  ORF Transcript_6165/g.13970 Transcript_6165/m.13970 type:complete len:141 (-) Transcript_6165:251-673(-)